MSVIVDGDKRTKLWIDWIAGILTSLFFDNITSQQELIYRKPMKAPLILNEYVVTICKN